MCDDAQNIDELNAQIQKLKGDLTTCKRVSNKHWNSFHTTASKLNNLKLSCGLLPQSSLWRRLLIAPLLKHKD